MGSILKYIVAIVLLVVFAAGAMLPPICTIHDESIAALQETEESTKGTEKIPSFELKEYYNGHGLVNCQSPVFLLNTRPSTTTVISFTQTFYGSVPTPPPDKI